MQIAPEEPKWGDTLLLTYNPKEEGAKLSDEIYVVASLFFTDHSRKSVWAKMNNDGSLFEHELPIPQDLCYISFYFVTRDDWDSQVSRGMMIYRVDGIPVKGAYERKMTFPSVSPDYNEFFRKEIALYPENFAAYKTKWQVIGSFDRENLSTIVSEDMKILSEQAKQETAEALYAMSYGYLILKEEADSRKILRQMVVRYPDSPLTYSAFGEYEYHVFAQQWKGEGPAEIQRLKWEMIRRDPDSDFARDQVASLTHEFPLPALEAICYKWIEAEPDNPEPYYRLAASYGSRKQKWDDASLLIEKAINLILQGRHRLYMDISGKLNDLVLASAYEISAVAALQLKNYGKALSSIKTAQDLQNATDPEIYYIEGQIWEAVTNFSKAETIYLEAFRKGSKEAEKSLEFLYKRKIGTLEGFPEYLAKLKEKPEEVIEDKKIAPSVRVSSLRGRVYDLQKLKGKVVVLNFWFVGCAPCIVEIPGLNELVKEFKDKDVVFLAFALDDPNSLKAFLKERKFFYEVIPESEEIAGRFDVSVFPTHLIIDKQGHIHARLMGGDRNRHNDLRPLILRAISE